MYNRAIKVADEILKKHPNHGETLSMKAMVLSYTSAPKPEVLDIARQVLGFVLIKTWMCFQKCENVALFILGVTR